MVRAYNAKYKVAEKRKNQAQIHLTDNTDMSSGKGLVSGDPEIDEYWRFFSDGCISRRCTLRGTDLILKTQLFTDQGLVAEPADSDWSKLSLVATLVGDIDEVNSSSTARVEIPRSKLSNSSFIQPSDLAPEYIVDSLEDNALKLLTLLSNMYPFLDLFYSGGSKKVMILKFNSPHD